jgi:hypothetical protein
MKSVLFCVLVSLVLVACVGGPVADERIVVAVKILNTRTKDYVESAAQPAITAYMEQLKKNLEQAKSSADQKKIDLLSKEIKNLEIQFKVGEELPKTTEELYKWSCGAPLEEEE